MIRIVLPYHLRTLVRVSQAVEIQTDGPMTIGLLLETLETMHPILSGTIRDHVTHERRPFIRFFACGQDLSLEPLDTLLPNEVITGAEPFRIVGAMAGG
jgi:molybdopterin synthase sulfur carrier subunit